MLCTECQFNTATTSEGLCGVCVVAAAHAQPAPRPGYMSDGRPAHLRSPVGLGRATVALLGVVIAADLYSLWAGTVIKGVTEDLLAAYAGTGFGARDLVREAERADTLYTISGWLQAAALVATCVVFLCWFYRVRVNAEVFEPHVHGKTRGWTVGSWFVPIVNLWFPRRIALDIWDASGDRSVALDRTLALGDASTRATHPLVNGWWTLWVASILVGRWASTNYWGAEELEEIDAAISRLMLADVINVAAAVLAILVVLRLTRMQDEKARSGPLTGGHVSA
ncbi:hypothetical protein GCM10010277_81200 [Streptomyces longisporoflavus]|uniref:DUF4328 domain-containing protein n=1 Tax=Streptomyces longisporoflavus TaxID=28044 RepID=UPI00167D63A3|nr:DUF4328 domain-containing protein [Streptomyces longisporoflavus]GGV70344.1 hypothetical protein GCM10010277_81200 [Streptomyces longisporoflavus]